MIFGIRNFLNTVADVLKLNGTMRVKLKSRLLYPCYRFMCKILWKFNYLYLDHVEIPVTQKCSLKCKKCCFMIPYFSKPVDYDVQDLLTYMDRLFSCVDRIRLFRVLGGEPFLYKDLGKILEKALACPKIKTVDIATNGTILPNDDLINILKNPKLVVRISDYGKYSRKKDELKALCEKKGIRCWMKTTTEKTWLDPAGLECRGRSIAELKKQMRACGDECRSFHDGRLYFCPRASFGTKFGIPDMQEDYVDFTQEIGLGKSILRKQIYDLNQKKYLTACNYCDKGTDKCVSVPMAEQIEE